MNDELISIVMATYNGEKYLSQQLDSICSQTYKKLEVIIVDDGSTDNTLSILNSYAAEDSRIHVFPAEKNLGVVLNFERGCQLAKGDFIALSDQDDIFHKDKIALLVHALKVHPDNDLVVSDLSLIDEKGAFFSSSMWRYASLTPQQGKPFRRLLYRNFATGCAMMVRRRLLDIAIPFPGDCLYHDWWLAVVAASSKAGGICLVDNQLTAYRQHNSNVCGIGKPLTLNLDPVISRVKAVSRGRENFEKRNDLYKLEIKRLRAYLQNYIWSSKERKLIEDSINMLSDFENDARCNVFSRLLKLPKRLRYSFFLGSFYLSLTMIMHTVLPYK